MFSSDILANQSFVRFSIHKRDAILKKVYLKYFGKPESGQSGGYLNSEKQARFKKMFSSNNLANQILVSSILKSKLYSKNV